MPTKQEATQPDLYSQLAGESEVFVGAPEPLKKDELIDVPFIITAWEWKHSEDTKRDYVQVAFLKEDGTRGLFSDGSTGVFAQLTEAKGAGKNPPFVCLKGLRVSRYANQFKEDNATYYIA